VLKNETCRQWRFDGPKSMAEESFEYINGMIAFIHPHTDIDI